MAFMKFGNFTTPVIATEFPKIGDKKENLIWDGENWVLITDSSSDSDEPSPLDSEEATSTP